MALRLLEAALLRHVQSGGRDFMILHSLDIGLYPANQLHLLQVCTRAMNEHTNSQWPDYKSVCMQHAAACERQTSPIKANGARHDFIVRTYDSIFRCSISLSSAIVR